MTIAEQIASQYDDDGQIFADFDGTEIEDVCRKKSTLVDEDGDHQRFTFSDGSILTISGAAWDLGFPCCYGWQGGDHSDDCPNSPVW